MPYFINIYVFIVSYILSLLKRDIRCSSFHLESFKKKAPQNFFCEICKFFFKLDF